MNRLTGQISYQCIDLKITMYRVVVSVRRTAYWQLAVCCF